MYTINGKDIAFAIDNYCARNRITKNRFFEESKITSATLSYWRTGENDAKPASIAKLEKYFGCPLEEFLEEYGEKEKTPQDEALEEENMKLRQTLMDRPEMKILYDTAKDAPVSAIYEAITIIMKAKEGSQN